MFAKFPLRHVQRQQLTLGQDCKRIRGPPVGVRVGHETAGHVDLNLFLDNEDVIGRHREVILSKTLPGIIFTRALEFNAAGGHDKHPVVTAASCSWRCSVCYGFVQKVMQVRVLGDAGEVM